MRLEGNCCCGQSFAVEDDSREICRDLYNAWLIFHLPCLDAFFEDAHDIDEAMRERYGRQLDG